MPPKRVIYVHLKATSKSTQTLCGRKTSQVVSRVLLMEQLEEGEAPCKYCPGLLVKWLWTGGFLVRVYPEGKHEPSAAPALTPLPETPTG